VPLRFKDGETLLRSGKPQQRISAIYIAGYGVECALKARLCDDLHSPFLPTELWHHDLQTLARKTTRWILIEGDPDRLRLFTFLLSEWQVSMRYAIRTYEEKDVRNFLDRAKEFTKWLFLN